MIDRDNHGCLKRYSNKKSSGHFPWVASSMAVVPMFPQAASEKQPSSMAHKRTFSEAKPELHIENTTSMRDSLVHSLQEFPQPSSSSTHSHPKDVFDPHAINDPATAASAMAASAFEQGFLDMYSGAVDAPLPSIVHEDRDDVADLDIDDNIILFNLDFPKSAGVVQDLRHPQEAADGCPEDSVTFDVGTISQLQKSELKRGYAKQNDSKKVGQKEGASASSNKNDALFNKKRTFSLREHMKESDPHPSDEETAHSFKSLSVKQPQYFSIDQVQAQPPLPSHKFSFVDLMNSAPHLAATVQRNVAISIASDHLMRKLPETKLKSNSASSIRDENTASFPNSHAILDSERFALRVDEIASTLPVHRNSDYPMTSENSRTGAQLDFQTPVIKKDPHSSSQKKKSKVSSKSTTSRPPMGASCGPTAASSGKERAVLRAPSSSDINATLSKKLVRSATHVYIANLIRDMKKTQENIQKLQEKQQQQQLRQQQEQRAQHSRLQQQQMQHQIQTQQQMMHYHLQRSHHGPAMQSQDSFLSPSGVASIPQFGLAPPPISTAKSAAQRPKSTSQSSLPGARGSHPNPNFPYMMMPPTAGQHAFPSPAINHVPHAPMGYPSSAYTAQAQAQAQVQYHNQYLAMQQLTQMNSMNQQHQFVRPSPPSTCHVSQTSNGLPYASLGYSSSPYMFVPSQGLSSQVVMAARPHTDFSNSRHSFSEQMKLLQQNQQKNLHGQLQSQLRSDASAPTDSSSRSMHSSPQFAANSLQGPSASAAVARPLSEPEHPVIKGNGEDSSQ